MMIIYNNIIIIIMAVQLTTFGPDTRGLHGLKRAKRKKNTLKKKFCDATSTCRVGRDRVLLCGKLSLRGLLLWVGPRAVVPLRRADRLGTAGRVQPRLTDKARERTSTRHREGIHTARNLNRGLGKGLPVFPLRKVTPIYGEPSSTLEA
jgi:hypothetical protein